MSRPFAGSSDKIEVSDLDAAASPAAEKADAPPKKLDESAR
jgi:hypothetical protein